MLMPYNPEPYVNFAEAEPRQKMLEALAYVKSQLGKSYPLVIGGEKIETSNTIKSVMPNNYETVVGFVAKGTKAHAEKALDVATETFKTWRSSHYEARAKILVKAAAIMRRRIYELSAWMCHEVGKSWIEAYADVAEAIDFCEFYAREMIRLGGSRPTTPFLGEDNEFRYIPLGVGVVIPPWNFALAITCGIASSAIVTGNCVVLKPASTAPVIAAIMCEIFEDAGLPAGVLNFCPGSGGEIGDTLVESPKTRFVSFTGSKEVGLGIYEKCGKVVPGQIWLKRAVLEMGGKDCMVIDETADLEHASEQIVAAAFGFQGQKCSACSRLIVVEEVHDALMEKVVDKASKLTVGDTTGEENYNMAAVIDDKAYEKIKSYIEIGKKEGKLVLGDQPMPEGGYFIAPTIIDNVDANARIAQEEIFGPVMAVIKAKDFDEALDIANGTEYGLTGALYSKCRDRLERARFDFHVGNLYFNRKCTGALVDVQPFGGFNMSGTDSKAGGRDYLQLFMQGKSITERF